MHTQSNPDFSSQHNEASSESVRKESHLAFQSSRPLYPCDYEIGLAGQGEEPKWQKWKRRGLTRFLSHTHTEGGGAWEPYKSKIRFPGLCSLHGWLVVRDRCLNLLAPAVIGRWDQPTPSRVLAFHLLSKKGTLCLSHFLRDLIKRRRNNKNMREIKPAERTTTTLGERPQKNPHK